MNKLIRRLGKVMDCAQYESLEATENRDERRRRVPVGHVPFIVGEEMERFAVRTDLLSRPDFVELLRRSAVVYGYDQTGVLRIPCSVQLFRRLLLTAEAGGSGEVVERRI